MAEAAPLSDGKSDASSSSEDPQSSSSDDSEAAADEDKSDEFAFHVDPERRKRDKEAASRKRAKKKRKQQPPQQHSRTQKHSRAGSSAAAGGEREPAYVYGDDPADFAAPFAAKGLPPVLGEDELGGARCDDEEKVSASAQNPEIMRDKDCDFWRVPIRTRDIPRVSMFYELSGQRDKLSRNGDLTRGAGVQVCVCCDWELHSSSSMHEAFSLPGGEF